MCLLCTDDLFGIDFGVVSPENPSHAEVGDFGVHVFIKENVACFEIAVNYSKS